MENNNLTPEQIKLIEDEAAVYATYLVNDVYYTSESDKKAYIAGATAQALKNESNWISVEDRLPEIGDEYNVVCDLEDAMERLLNKFKQDPYYEIKHELGMMCMKHINDLTDAERRRYDEICEILKTEHKKLNNGK